MKMPDRIDNIMLAPCGINCIACYKHLKPKKACEGCLAGDEYKPEHCRKCPIKDCTREKGIVHCFECKDFPCKRITSLEKSYTQRYGISLKQNSIMARNEGIDALMACDQQRWACTRCGGIISQHDKVCSECGNPTE